MSVERIQYTSVKELRKLRQRRWNPRSSRDKFFSNHQTLYEIHRLRDDKLGNTVKCTLLDSFADMKEKPFENTPEYFKSALSWQLYIPGESSKH